MATVGILPMFINFFSILLGIAVFYIVSEVTKKQKKKRAQEAFSQIINLILFLWLAKILLNLPLLFSDPLALLAYPSDSQSFYLAIAFSAALLLYGVRSGRIHAWETLQTLLYILLPASFFYEFAQLTWFDDGYAFGNLILSGVLLALFLMLNGKASPYRLGTVLIGVWAAGMLLIFSLQSFASTFGYVMKPWFIVTLFIAGYFFMLLSSRRRAINEFD
ncbi:hypothetical protein DHX103_11485 [Planococcus sp. X10-3]|uniref:hypothetical protein n=1 Tax=Planococcus sp. X10-3 TaxID=3061240 RepID=UPI003BB1C7A9